ncbi:MAG: hypothetical protein ABFD91_07460, partial [Anaerohalosphaeraceae bacterium]
MPTNFISSIKQTILAIVFFGFVCGCEEQLRPMEQDTDIARSAAVLSAVPEQDRPAVPSSIPEVKSGQTALIAPISDSGGFKPAICRLIPANMQTEVWNTLLGTSPIVHVRQLPQTTDFFVLDELHTRILRAARSKTLGTKSGSILILAGVNFETQNPAITGPFSFESGKPMPGTGIYAANKTKFLSQFSSGTLQKTTSKIQGITGATMIWKPVAKEIQQISSDLIKLGQDPSYIDSLVTENQIWKRSSPTAEPDANPVPANQVTISPEQSNSQPTLAQNSFAPPAPLPAPATQVEMETEDQTDMLSAHWQWIGF